MTVLALLALLLKALVAFFVEAVTVSVWNVAILQIACVSAAAGFVVADKQLSSGVTNSTGPR